MKDDFRTRPKAVKAVLFTGGAAQGVEVVRWMTKWDIEARYIPGDDVVSFFTTEGFGAKEQTLFPDHWLIFHPRSGTLYTVSDKLFGLEHE